MNIGFNVFLPPVLFCHTLDAVSYTHLDVYKRQQLRRVRLGMCFRFTTPIIAEQTRR